MEGRNALLGQWTDPDGNRFRDAGFAVSGISFRQALVFKSLFEQEMLEVTRYGVRPV